MIIVSDLHFHTGINDAWKEAEEELYLSPDKDKGKGRELSPEERRIEEKIRKLGREEVDLRNSIEVFLPKKLVFKDNKNRKKLELKTFEDLRYFYNDWKQAWKLSNISFKYNGMYFSAWGLNDMFENDADCQKALKMLQDIDEKTARLKSINSELAQLYKKLFS